VNEGDRIGTVEHSCAGVVESGASLNDLMVGGPLNRKDLLQPTRQLRWCSTVRGYTSRCSVRARQREDTFDLAQSESGEALLTQAVQPRTRSAAHAVFSQGAAVASCHRQLLQAQVAGERVVQTPREGRSGNRAGSADDVGGQRRGVSTADVFLPVLDTMMSPLRQGQPVRRRHAQAFRGALAVPARAFDTGASARLAIW
jgi:hypothetical protein